MKITATQIESWADTRDAQGLLPILVRRLIAATSKTTALTMPGGDSVGEPGWDGVVDVSEGSAWVPVSGSRWEMGCSGDVLNKARTDFKKRTEEVSMAEAAGLVFVFVTPRRWRNKQAWIDAASKDGPWKAVVVLDADDLEAWLENAPSVTLWFGEQLGLSGSGIESVSHVWENWRSQTRIPLTATALYSGREQARANFRDVLNKAPALIGVEADSSDEAVAFACAMLLDEGRASVACCVTSDAGWRFVDANPGLQVCVATSPEVAGRRAPRCGLTLIVPLSVGDRPAQLIGSAARAAEDVRIVLARPPGDEFEKALLALGEEAADAARLVRAVGRSWSVYRRVRARNPHIRRPAWANDPFPRSLATLTLVGAWSNDKGGDRSCIEAVSGRPYSDVEAELRQFALLDDSPVLLIGSVWKAKAPLELLYLLGSKITTEEMTRFFNVAETILIKPDPSLELEEEKRWMAGVYGKVREESGLVIDSIVDGLAKLSVYAEGSTESRAFEIKRGVDRLVRKLLNDADEQRWLSLHGVLRELAEAAPDEFLRSVEESLQRPEVPVRRLLTETQRSGGFGRCWHASLLWALEVLAWSPARLARVADVLAQLATTPIKGNWANTPLRTLESFFRVWWPQTAASVQQRISVLDRLIRMHNDVAWDLMYSQVPRFGGFATANARPHWRDDDSGTASQVTQTELGQAIAEIGSRIVAQAARNPTRIAQLVDALDSFDGEYLDEIIRLVEDASKFDDEGREIVRNSVRNYLNWHNSFNRDGDRKSRTAADKLRSQFEALSPHDLILKHRWIFENGWVALPDGREDDFQAQENMRDKCRTEALTEILTARGLPGVSALAAASSDKRLVGYQLAKSDLSEEPIAPWLAREFADAGGKYHVPLVAGYLYVLLPERRRKLLASLIDTHTVEIEIGGESYVAALLANAPCDRSTWDILETLPTEIQGAYWQNIRPGFIQGTVSDLSYAGEKLISANRPRTAFECMSLNYKDFDSEVLVSMLEDIRTGKEPDGPLPDGWHIGEAIKAAAESGKIPRRRLALLEFAFFTGLEHGEHGANILFEEVAAEPSLFVELICLAFKRRNEPDEERAEANKTAAELAWHVLHNGRRIPGILGDGTVDRAAFDKWIDRVRQSAKENDRAEVADICIGQWLSRCPNDPDGNWPCAPVRDLLDNANAEKIRQGFCTGVLNNRGVTTRGVTDGGEQERVLAERYEQFAARLQNSHPLAAAALTDIAAHYRAYARQHDWDAQLRIEGH